MFPAINPQAYAYLWAVAVLAVIVLSVVMVYHWWRYLVNKGQAFTVTLVYLAGLIILFSLSSLALYGVIK